VSSFTSHSTHNRSFRRRVFPGNHLHWYWRLKTNSRKYTKNTK